MGISFDHTTSGQRVLFGSGAVVENSQLAVSGCGASRVLLIADHFAARLADDLAARIPVVARIDDIAQHVPIERARDAQRIASESRADAVLSIGGGSCTGLAKIVARETGIPIIAVPTTFAGSEATNVWGITEGGRKTTGVDDRVLPKVVIYDSAVLASLPPTIAVASGLNAVAHAVDGFWAPHADPINTALGTEGLRALVPALRSMETHPAPPDTIDRMLYGAYLAAVAFASAGSGLHHKICHVIGGAYGLDHASMHAVVLPYVTAFNAPAAPDAAHRISTVMDSASPAGGLFDLREQLGLVGSLRELGMPEDGIERVAGLVLEAMPASNPRVADRDSLEGIIRSAWLGETVE